MVGTQEPLLDCDVGYRVAGQELLLDSSYGRIITWSCQSRALARLMSWIVLVGVNIMNESISPSGVPLHFCYSHMIPSVMLMCSTFSQFPYLTLLCLDALAWC
jgi:hypothetical protein